MDDELQTDQLDDGDATDGGDSGSDNSAPPSDDQAAAKESKRINDLMSNWQKAEARANAAEARLAQLAGNQGDAGEAAQGDAGNGRDAELDEFREFARENARVQLFSSLPELATAGLSAEDIAGSTLEEMKASAKKHLKTINGIEGRLRNKILSEHGLDPEVSTGAGTEAAPSFSTMSDKEFADFIAARDSRPR